MADKTPKPSDKGLLRKSFQELTDADKDYLRNVYHKWRLENEHKFVSLDAQKEAVAQILAFLIKENKGKKLNNTQMQAIANAPDIHVGDRGKVRTLARVFGLHPVVAATKAEFVLSKGDLKEAIKFCGTTDAEITSYEPGKAEDENKPSAKPSEGKIESGLAPAEVK